MTTSYLPTRPEVKPPEIPVPTPVPQRVISDDGSALYPSRSRPGLFHALSSAMIGGRMLVSGCTCEAGALGRTCWHKRDLQAEFDRREEAREAAIDEAIEAEAEAYRQFLKAWAAHRRDQGNALKGRAADGAYARLEMARAARDAALDGDGGQA